ncbi:MAG TPA: PatB family C-S lyase [Anaerolineales bacterium]
MNYNFDQFPDRRSTESVKWNTFGPDVLPMWVADMDFVSPAPVIQALRQRVEHGIFGYPQGIGPDASGLSELRQAVVSWLARRHGWTVLPEDLMLVPGVVTGVNLACHTLATPGGGVLVETPVYTPILDAPHQAGMKRQEVELTRLPGGSYAIDWEAFERAITPETRLFILCNPHNPVGRAFTREELARMAEICLRHGVKICSDEIHCDLTYTNSRHIPLASLSPEIARNTITLIAPSKTFNLAGLECSFAVIPNPELRKQYAQSGKGLVGWVNLMGMVAAKAAYSQGQEWLDQLLVYLEGNRDFLREFVRQELPGIQMAPPEATYLAWLDCREAGLADPYRFFLENAQVACNDGKIFGQGGDGFVRLNFGCPRAMLTEALERMKQALLSKR